MSRKPYIIGISGAGSNCGKTSLVGSLIQRLSPHWKVGAVKVATSTPDHRCGRTGLPCSCLRFEGRMRLLKDAEYTERPGKDTARFRAAGAEPVWWLQATQDFASEAARFFMDDLPDCDVLIIEGGAFIRDAHTDLALVVRRHDDDQPKLGFEAALARADFLLLSRRGDADVSLEAPSGPREVLTFDPDSGGLPAPLLDRIVGEVAGPTRR